MKRVMECSGCFMVGEVEFCGHGYAEDKRLAEKFAREGVWYPSAEDLAKEFCQALRHYIGAKKMAVVIERNRAEKDPAVCHSHDFCDANAVMDSAFRWLTGFDTGETGSGDNCPCMSDECLKVWNEAWSMAKKAEFNLGEPAESWGPC